MNRTLTPSPYPATPAKQVRKKQPSIIRDGSTSHIADGGGAWFVELLNVLNPMLEKKFKFVVDTSKYLFISLS
jgi:hypothetical protein